MADTDFPDDLLAGQTRLHQALAEYSALCRTLPWSVDPAPGWPGEKALYGDGEVGGRPDSPGYTEQQKTDVARLHKECVALSTFVGTHPYWATLECEARVDARMELKAVTQPTTVPAVDVETAA